MRKKIHRQKSQCQTLTFSNSIYHFYYIFLPVTRHTLSQIYKIINNRKKCEAKWKKRNQNNEFSRVRSCDCSIEGTRLKRNMLFLANLAFVWIYRFYNYTKSNRSFIIVALFIITFSNTHCCYQSWILFANHSNTQNENDRKKNIPRSHKSEIRKQE